MFKILYENYKVTIHIGYNDVDLKMTMIMLNEVNVA